MKYNKLQFNGFNKNDFEKDFGNFLCNDVRIENYNLILQVGSTTDLGNGTFKENYKKTLRLYSGDWLIYDRNTLDLFVVDDKHINEFKD